MSLTLVAGLGNPGRDYDNTRHNLGFLVLDAWARKRGLAWKHQSCFSAETIRCDALGNKPLILAKPQTYMNDSGRALSALSAYYKLEPTSVVVLYDDLTIDLGLVKVSISGSAGGHNGIASILENIGNGFVRYRLGIGPKQPAQMDIKDFVLGKFTSDQQLILDQSLTHYLTGLDLLLTQGTERAMNTLNRRETK